MRVNKPKKQKPTILIIDDDKQVLKSLKIWLKNEGYRPLTAPDGEEALKILRENFVEVALIDFRMSKEDGVSVAQRLREIDDMLKVIILTGFPSYETAVAAMKSGVSDYISKGSSNEKILEAIKKAISDRDSKNTSPHESLPLAKNDMRIILFCNHSLLKEQLENHSKKKTEFKLVKSFPNLNAPGIKNVTQQIDIALLCAGCNLSTIKDAYTVLPELYRLFPEIKPVIINENFSDQEKVELLKLGVKGFSSVDLGSEKLEEALRRVKKGEIWVSRNVTNLSLQNMSHYNSALIMKAKEPFDLTEREIEILRTMALGLKNKEIADKLYISEKTVKTHINHVFRKLEVDTRAKAIFKAVENKII